MVIEEKKGIEARSHADLVDAYKVLEAKGKAVVDELNGRLKEKGITDPREHIFLRGILGVLPDSEDVVFRFVVNARHYADVMAMIDTYESWTYVKTSDDRVKDGKMHFCLKLKGEDKVSPVDALSGLIGYHENAPDREDGVERDTKKIFTGVLNGLLDGTGFACSIGMVSIDHPDRISIFGIRLADESKEDPSMLETLRSKFEKCGFPSVKRLESSLSIIVSKKEFLEVAKKGRIGFVVEAVRNMLLETIKS
jgi:hypothetical protein